MAREKRDNNFNIIRFVAAIMVMAGHMAYIGSYTLPTLWGEGARSKNLLFDWWISYCEKLGIRF